MIDQPCMVVAAVTTMLLLRQQFVSIEFRINGDCKTVYVRGRFRKKFKYDMPHGPWWFNMIYEITLDLCDFEDY